MDRDVSDRPEIDTDVLAFDVPDDVLERTAGTEGKAITWAYCTYWHQCGWPV